MSGWVKSNVVVPVDFSDESFAALDTALEIAGQAANVHLVHVLPPLSPVEPGELWDTITDEGRAEHVRKELAKRLTDSRYQGISTDVVFGDAGHEIAHFAEQRQADLIVLPSRGLTGLKRILVGSVAERVVRLSHCPVLVLRH